MSVNLAVTTRTPPLLSALSGTASSEAILSTIGFSSSSLRIKSTDSKSLAASGQRNIFRLFANNSFFNKQPLQFAMDLLRCHLEAGRTKQCLNASKDSALCLLQMLGATRSEAEVIKKKRVKIEAFTAEGLTKQKISELLLAVNDLITLCQYWRNPKSVNGPAYRSDSEDSVKNPLFLIENLTEIIAGYENKEFNKICRRLLKHAERIKVSLQESGFNIKRKEFDSDDVKEKATLGLNNRSRKIYRGHNGMATDQEIEIARNLQTNLKNLLRQDLTQIDCHLRAAYQLLTNNASFAEFGNGQEIRLHGYRSPADPFQDSKPYPISLNFDFNRDNLLLSGGTASGDLELLRTAVTAILLHRAGLPVPCVPAYQGSSFEIGTFGDIFLIQKPDHHINIGTGNFGFQAGQFEAVINSCKTGDIVFATAPTGSSNADSAALSAVFAEMLKEKGAKLLMLLPDGDYLDKMAELGFSDIQYTQVLPLSNTDTLTHSEAQSKKTIAEIVSLVASGSPFGYAERLRNKVKSNSKRSLKELSALGEFRTSKSQSRLEELFKKSLKLCFPSQLFTIEQSFEMLSQWMNEVQGESFKDRSFPAFGNVEEKDDWSQRYKKLKARFSDIQLFASLDPEALTQAQFGLKTCHDALVRLKSSIDARDPASCYPRFSEILKDLRLSLDILPGFSQCKDAHLQYALEYIYEGQKEFVKSYFGGSQILDGIDHMRYLDMFIGISLSIPLCGYKIPQIGNSAFLSLKGSIPAFAMNSFGKTRLRAEISDWIESERTRLTAFYMNITGQHIMLGPNSSGKTALASTIGIEVAKAMHGFPTISDIEMPEFAGILALFGEDRTAKSTITSLLAINAKLQSARDQWDGTSSPVLVLLDELSAVDNHEDAAALANALSLISKECRSLLLHNTHARHNLDSDIARISHMGYSVSSDQKIKPTFVVMDGPDPEAFGLEVIRLEESTRSRALRLKSLLTK